MLVPAALLVIAVLPLPYGYYQLLRLAVTAVALYIAWSEYQASNGMTGWALAFGLCALLFNPLIPVHLSRESWFVIDLAVAGIFGAYWFVVGGKQEPKG